MFKENIMITILGKRETQHSIRQFSFWSLWLLLLLTAFILQDKGLLITPHDYHHFVDNRTALGIHNLMDVISNAPFLVIGTLMLRSSYFESQLKYKKENYDSLSLIIISLGTLLVGMGSAYYHWNPTDNTLVWDRIPMAIVFSGVITYVIQKLDLLPKQINIKKFELSYLLLSLSSVLIWYVGTLLNHNWLALYVFIQFGGMILLCYLAGSSYSIENKILLNTILKVMLIYVLAKLTEHYDGLIYHLDNEWISGHTIKHLLSVLALYVVYLDWFRLIKEKN